MSDDEFDDQQLKSRQPKSLQKAGALSVDRPSLVLSPAQLRQFSEVDPDLPAMIIKAEESQRQRSFIFQMAALSMGFVLQLVMIGAAVYLVTIKESVLAGALFGTDGIAIVSLFLRQFLKRD